MRRPDFFLVGAPKCGTTAMNEYLALHPDIFMATKEIHFFGSDLNTRVTPTEEEYLQHFKNAEDKKVVGEASVWYLYSKKAAMEIKKYSPQAKILIMLRNPVDMLHSLHSQHLFDSNEDIKDFRQALFLDEERKAGKNLPKSVDFVTLPPYRESAMFSEQVKRYIDTFGKENVHVILYDDFVKNTSKVVADTFKFLSLAPVVLNSYEVINANKKIRFLTLNKFLKRPAAFTKSIVRAVIPVKKVRHQMMAKLFSLNTKLSKRKKLDTQLELELREFFREDIRKLSDIIDRDLSAWM